MGTALIVLLTAVIIIMGVVSVIYLDKLYLALAKVDKDMKNMANSIVNNPQGHSFEVIEIAKRTLFE